MFRGFLAQSRGFSTALSAYSREDVPRVTLRSTVRADMSELSIPLSHLPSLAGVAWHLLAGVDAIELARLKLRHPLLHSHWRNTFTEEASEGNSRFGVPTALTPKVDRVSARRDRQLLLAWRTEESAYTSDWGNTSGWLLLQYAQSGARLWEPLDFAPWDNPKALARLVQTCGGDTAHLDCEACTSNIRAEVRPRDRGESSDSFLQWETSPSTVTEFGSGL